MISETGVYTIVLYGVGKNPRPLSYLENFYWLCSSLSKLTAVGANHIFFLGALLEVINQMLHLKGSKNYNFAS